MFAYTSFSQNLFFRNLITGTDDTEILSNPFSYKPVYSDRVNNLTKKDFFDNSTHDSLPFLEKYYFIEENQNQINLFHINNFDSIAISNPGKIILKDKGINKGWIQKENLLVNERSLFTQDSLSFLKGIIVNDLTDLTYYYTINAYKSNFFYMDPYLSNTTFITPQLFSIYYIYKEYKENNISKSLLLGTAERFTQKDAVKEIIKGWYPKKRVFVLNKNIFIEPNWEQEAVEERKSKGIKAELFFYPNNASDFQLGIKTSNEYKIWFQDSFKRSSPNQIRLLVDEKNDGNILKVVYFSQEQPYYYNFCYTSFTHKNLIYPLYKYVFLLSMKELAILLKNLEVIKDVITNSKDRSNFRDLYAGFLEKKHLSKDEIKKMTITEANQKIFGFPLMKNTIGNTTIKQIKYQTPVSDIDYQNFINDFLLKYNELERILNGNSKYYFKSNDITYYWISEENLP